MIKNFAKKSSNLLVIAVLLVTAVAQFFGLFTGTARASVTSTSDAYYWSSLSTIQDQTAGINFTDQNTKDSTNAYGGGNMTGCNFNDNIVVVNNGFFGGIFHGGNISFGDIKGSVGGSPAAIIDIGSTPTTSTTSGTLYLVQPNPNKPSPNGPECEFQKAGSITIGNGASLGQSAAYAYKDTYNIAGTGSDTRTFQLVSPSNTTFYGNIALSDNIPAGSVVYADASASSCQSFIVLNTAARNVTSVDPSSGMLYNWYSPAGGGCARGVLTTFTSRGGSGQAPTDTSPTPITIQNTQVFDLATVRSPDATKTTNPTSGNGSVNPNPKDPSTQCDSALSPFGWVLCPVLDVVNSVYDFFANFIASTLFFGQDKYSGGELQKSSQVFVSIANVAIVLFALLMIASQIFSFDIFSAYTVKKVLPRIVIGAILIQLSWPIFTTVIQITNAIGTGLYYLLITPFGLIPSGSIKGFVSITDIIGASSTGGSNAAAQASGGLLLILAGVGAVAAAFVTGAWISIIVTVIGILISLLVAIVTLIIRELVIIVLLAIAPLAVAFWIFPGTKRYWDMWWSNFIKLLLMYPIIMLLFAGGAIAAHILIAPGSNATSGGIDFSKLAAIIAYFAPIFLIGATFKFAGGALNSLNGMTGKLGSRAKGSGMFGLKKAAENNKASRAYNRKQLGNRIVGGEGPRFTHNRLGRTIGRGMAGSAGARGEYSRILRQQEEKSILDNAQQVLDDTIRSNKMDYSQKKALHQAIASASTGDDVDLSKIMVGTGQRDAAGNEIMKPLGTGKVRASSSLQQQVLSSAASNKYIDAIDTFSAKTDSESKAILERAKDTNFGAFDAIAPDIARGGSVMSADNRPLSTARYDQLKGSPAGFAGPKIEGVSGRQQIVASTLRDDLSAGGDRLDQALIELNKYASSPHQETDARAMQHLATTLAGSGRVDAQTVLSVINSSGNQKLSIDPSGNIVAISAAT